MSQKSYQDISLEEFRALRQSPGAVVVDVREKWEYEEFNEGGINIPLSQIREKRPLLTAYDDIFVICTNGTRSRVAAMDYCRVPEWKDKNIYHLKGGILEAD
jgi:rhodanese-related sulfurtransferase